MEAKFLLLLLAAFLNLQSHNGSKENVKDTPFEGMLSCICMNGLHFKAQHGLELWVYHVVNVSFEESNRLRAYLVNFITRL